MTLWWIKLFIHWLLALLLWLCGVWQLPGKILTESGKPADVIINTAAHEKAGLIVLGSRGLGRLKRTFTSASVSDHVLHRAKCPVVICRAMDQTASRVNTSRSSSTCSNNLWPRSAPLRSSEPARNQARNYRRGSRKFWSKNHPKLHRTHSDLKVIARSIAFSAFLCLSVSYSLRQNSPTNVSVLKNSRKWYPYPPYARVRHLPDSSPACGHASARMLVLRWLRVPIRTKFVRIAFNAACKQQPVGSRYTGRVVALGTARRNWKGGDILRCTKRQCTGYCSIPYYSDIVKCVRRWTINNRPYSTYNSVLMTSLLEDINGFMCRGTPRGGISRTHSAILNYYYIVLYLTLSRKSWRAEFTQHCCASRPISFLFFDSVGSWRGASVLQARKKRSNGCRTGLNMTQFIDTFKLKRFIDGDKLFS